MADIQKSHSYPERLKESHERKVKEERAKLESDVKTHAETLHAFRKKDHQRAERFARLGSPSSTEVIVHINWHARCCRAMTKAVNFFLEREEESRRQDELIQSKSYAGFYYFIKWFIRALFFLIFTILGTIAGKEIGCEIVDHDTCNSGVVELADSSPHIVASIIGFVFGLLVGQWVGRIIWDKMTSTIQHCLRKIEKKADRTKAWLVVTAGVVYIVVTGAFTVVFLFFVDLNQDDENIIGAVVGGCIGLVLAMLAYRKSSSCRSGQSDTPMVCPSSSTLVPPEIIVQPL